MLKKYIVQPVLDLRSDFWGTLFLWQTGRGVWLLLAGTALSLEIFSWAVFQNLLRLKPCEYCVYIRFAMLAICLGALVAAVLPRNALFRLAGFGLSLWWTVQGFLWSLSLHEENVRAADPDWISSCGDGKITFPLGLKLDQWLPSHFKPLALCGQDSAWALFGLSMPEWLFIIYGCFAVLLLLMLLSWLKRLVSRRQK